MIRGWEEAMKRALERIGIAFAVIVCLCAQTLATPEALVPVGRTVGLRLQGELTVAALEDGARHAGLRVGDRIITVNGTEATSVEELRSLIENETEVRLSVDRGGQTLELDMEPTKTDEGARLGIRVRDGVSGVGTVTFYDPETGRFGALGHGVNDPNTGRRVDLRCGSVLPCRVTDVERGRTGAPGELHGAVDGRSPIGRIEKNTAAGIFGVMDLPPQTDALPLADTRQVQAGPAKILSNVAGEEVQAFGVTLLKIDPDNRDGRNYLLQVCDDALLSVTGGIVQGMSGSPIVQDGRLVGAVTHVLVDDPTIGYGISIENMLAASDAAGT